MIVLKSEIKDLRPTKSKSNPLYKRLWPWIGMITVILFLFCIYFFLSYWYGPSHTSKVLADAIESEDAQDISSQVIGPSNMKITSDSVKPFILYLKEHPDYKEKIIKEVNDQGDNRFVNQPLFDLKQYKKRKWGLFKVYVFSVKPYSITITPTRENTKVSFNTKTITARNQSTITFNGLFPGKYEVSGVWKGKYAKLQDQQTVILTSAKNQNQSITLDLKGQNINLHTNRPNATVFINNQETQLKAKDIVNFGPISPGLQISLQTKELPWGKVRSGPIKVVADKKDYTLALSPFDDNTLKEILNSINTFAQQRALANRNKDVNEYRNVDSSYKVDLETEIKYMGTTKGWKGAKLLKTVYDLDSLDYEINYRNEYIVDIPAKFIYHVDTNKKKIEQHVLVSVAYIKDKKNWKISYCNESDFPIDVKKLKTFNY